MKKLCFFLCILFIPDTVGAKSIYDLDPLKLSNFLSTKPVHTDPYKLSTEVLKLSKKTDIRPTLILAVMKVESEFNAKAINKNNEYVKGIMQVYSKANRKIIGKQNLFDAVVNTRVGTKILHNCKISSSNERGMLSCYTGYKGKSLTHYVTAIYKAEKCIQREVL